MEKKEFGSRGTGNRGTGNRGTGNRGTGSRGTENKGAGNKGAEKRFGTSGDGKKVFLKSDSGKREYGKTDSGKREYGKSDAGKSDFGKREYGKTDSGKREFGKREYGKTGAGKREYGHGDSEKREYGKTDSGRTEFVKREYGKTDSGKKEFGKREYGKTDAGKREYGRGDSEKREYAKTDSGRTEFVKREYGKTDSGKKEFGKREYGKTDSGKREFGKREYGKTDAGKREYGRGDSEKREYGKTDSGRTEFVKREYGKTDSGKKEFGKREYGKTDSGKREYVRGDSEKREYKKVEPGKKYFIKGGIPKKKFQKKKLEMSLADTDGERQSDDLDMQILKEKSKGKLCPVYNKCGGCQLLHLPYKKQLEQKQAMLEELLTGLCPLKPIIGMKEPFHYRNKVHAVFDHDKKGNVFSGVYKEGTHIVIPVEKCMIEDEKADEIIGTIRELLPSFKLLIYDEDTGYGFMRHVLIKRGFATGEIMVVLVTASPIFPSKGNFVKALLKKHPDITTIIQNVNDRVTNMVLGNKEAVLYGKGYIEDILCGYRFRISPRSFYQVNPVQAEVLYKKVLELAKLTGKETVLDAYCGVGTIGISISKHAAKVIGVELNEDAVKDAVQNAKQNDVTNVQFYCNDAGRFIANMAEKGERADVVIMDPPRSGSTKEFIDAVALMGPERVVYVSCGPETLERDLRLFKDKGYRAVEGWPVDMFAHTKHVETVVLLSHIK